MTTLLTHILNLLAPRFCSVCGNRLKPGEKGLCINCLMDLDIVAYADATESNKLERTFWLRIPIARAAAFMSYDRESSQRELVLDIKYHNQPKTGYFIGSIMAQRLKETDFFDTIDIIMPVPISQKHLRRRGYNQSLQLAQGISHTVGIPIDNKSIKRKNYTVTQSRLSAAERRENIKGTFILHQANNLKGKHILIVDDVITTGYTIEEMGLTLCQIPEIKISVLSLAVSKHLIANIRNANP